MSVDARNEAIERLVLRIIRSRLHDINGCTIQRIYERENGKTTFLFGSCSGETLVIQNILRNDWFFTTENMTISGGAETYYLENRYDEILLTEVGENLRQE
jgi:hypothetical protein